MTMQELKKLDQPFVLVSQVAEIIGAAPQAIRVQARDNPDALGFPVTRIGCKTYIPRLAFIKFVENGIKEGKA